MKRLIIYSLVLTIALSSCGPQIYVAPSFDKVKKSHETLAILPFDVAITAKKLPKGVTPEMLKDQEKSNGYALQSDVYSYFLKEMSKGKYTVEFQDIDKTNSLLETAGFEYEDLRTVAKEKLIATLGVNALISGKVVQEKPMSEGAAIALGLLVGVWGSTNEVTANLTIHNEGDGKLLWKYDYVASGSVGTSTSSLSKYLMKNVSKKFPYKKEQ